MSTLTNTDLTNLVNEIYAMTKVIGGDHLMYAIGDAIGRYLQALTAAQEELARANQAITEQTKREFNLIADLTTLKSDFAALQSSAQNGAEDGKRLDWLIANRAHVGQHEDGMFDVWKPGRSYEEARGKTARRAIDSARAKQENNP